MRYLTQSGNKKQKYQFNCLLTTLIFSKINERGGVLRSLGAGKTNRKNSRWGRPVYEAPESTIEMSKAVEITWWTIQ